MSGGDNFLSRWSSRKDDARRAEQVEADAATPAPSAENTQTDQPPAETTAAPPTEPTAEPEAPLPSLDDVTAESDVTAFLHKNVPEALRKAALRKAWSLDPAIRDFASPAEYDWDFNAPAAMAGFGPIGAGHTTELLLASAIGMQSTGAGHIAESGRALSSLAPRVERQRADPVSPPEQASGTTPPPVEDEAFQAVPEPPHSPPPGAEEVRSAGVDLPEHAEPSPRGTRHGSARPS